MKSSAKTVTDYIASLPQERQPIIEKIRDVILANLDQDYEEGMQYGMIGYFVPHRVYAPGYHCNPDEPLPYAALASQKNYISLYLMGLYCGSECDARDESQDVKWFREAWLKSGKNLKMGKACVRFKSVEDVPLDVIGEAIKRLPPSTYIERYEKARAAQAKR